MLFLTAKQKVQKHGRHVHLHRLLSQNSHCPTNGPSRYFSHCHPMAPFMCIQTQRSAAFVRQSNLALFISVCAVGARFWSLESSQSPRDGSSTQYRALIETLDATISRLLLQPKLADVNLDHIRCLLLYIQWMPIEQHSSGASHTRCKNFNYSPLISFSAYSLSFLLLCEKSWRNRFSF